jgi:Tfp pilus assembly protein PilF
MRGTCSLGLLLALFVWTSVGCNAALKDRPPLAKAFKHEPAKNQEQPPEAPLSEAVKTCLANAQELEDKGRDAEAILLYERARTYNPQATQISPRLAVLYQRQGRYSEALAEYQKAVAAKPKDADLLNDLGFFHFERGNWVEAEKTLRDAVAANPKHAQAWGNLGLTLGHAGRYQESLEAFQKAVKPAEAYANLGMILAQQQKPNEAKEALQRAVELDPGMEQTRRALAWLEMSTEDRAEILKRQQAQAQAANAPPVVPRR